MKEKIFSNTLEVLKDGKAKLWGISLFGVLVTMLCSSLVALIPALSIIIAILLSTGMKVIYLRKTKGEKVHCANLFDVFKDFKTAKRVVLGSAWQFLWIFIWSLIPIVGIYFAIKRALEYYLTIYILIYEPDVEITKALEVSRERMQGYKKDVFLCYFYILGSIIGSIILLFILGLIPYVGVLFNLLAVLIWLCSAVLLPMILGVLKSEFFLEIESNKNKVFENNGNNFI